MRLTFLSLVLVTLLTACKPEPVRIATVGHTYYAARDTLVFNALIDSIRERDPDYLFVLGDWVWSNVDWEWERALNGFAKVGDEVYFSPGNHELINVDEVSHGIDSSLVEYWQKYETRMGYYHFFF